MHLFNHAYISTLGSDRTGLLISATFYFLLNAVFTNPLDEVVEVENHGTICGVDMASGLHQLQPLVALLQDLNDPNDIDNSQVMRETKETP